MSRHGIALFFFGIGIAALLFSLFRTYYLVRKLKKEREAKGYFQEKIARYTENDKG
jgi:hypothetical protein